MHELTDDIIAALQARFPRISVARIKYLHQHHVHGEGWGCEKYCCYWLFDDCHKWSDILNA
jgi:hypothetical protein